MRDTVRSIMAKYRAKIPPNWPVKGDTIHFTDRCNGRLYTGVVLEWVSTGPKETDIYWRVKTTQGDIISCEFDELTQVDRAPENEDYVNAYNRGEDL